MTVASSTPSTGASAPALGRPESVVAGIEWIVQRPSSWRSESGSSAVSRAVRVARPRTRVGVSTRSCASARSIHVLRPPAWAMARVSSAEGSWCGARSRNSSTVPPSGSGCVWRVRMSTALRARAVQSAAREPGSSRTVVRIRHRTVVAALAPGPAVAADGVGSVGAVLTGGGAWLWRRAHQVWKAAVTRSATAEATSRTGPLGPCTTRLAMPSATATAQKSAASSTTSRRQWWRWGRWAEARLRSVMHTTVAQGCCVITNDL